jgi:hypothetical protein
MADHPGKPLKFKTPEILEQKIQTYFDSCYEYNEATGKTENIRPLTISGLALALDTNRQTLLNYKNYGDGYFDSIKKAKERVENWTEEQLYRKTQVVGVIFNLKNNYDWKDKTELDHTTGGEKLPVAINIINPHGNKLPTEPEAIPSVAVPQ